MTKIARIDFETFSLLDLSGKESAGTWNYASHPSTEIMMMAYKLPGMPRPSLWQPRLGPLPDDIHQAFLNPEFFIGAFHSTFERLLLKFKLNIDIPIWRFIDSQPSARYLSMPGDLASVSKILGLPKQFAKDARGDELIDLFCMMQKLPKKRKEEQKYYRADWTTHPKEWEEFCEYCIQDVIAEEEISRRMELIGALPLPPLERKIWEFDQKVNDRGMPVDMDFVIKAYKLALRSKQEAQDRQTAITNLPNANSPAQLKTWLKERGYPFNTIRKETVESVLNDPEIKITDDAREVLKSRSEASSTSYQKLNAIIRQISPDGRLRGQFIYMGSARCGRWAGNAVQLHNMARPNKVFEDMENVIAARQMIYREDYDAIKQKFGSVLLTVKNVIRTVFVA